MFVVSFYCITPQTHRDEGHMNKKNKFILSTPYEMYRKQFLLAVLYGEIKCWSQLGVKKVNRNCIITSVYSWKSRILRLRLIAINNSYVVVRIETRNVGKLFLFSTNPLPPPPPLPGPLPRPMASKKSQLEVDDQSCKGPLCKFRSTSFFHYFTKGKIFDITFQLKQIVTQTFHLTNLISYGN